MYKRRACKRFENVVIELAMINLIKYFREALWGFGVLAFWVVRQERLFEDAFAGARFTEHQTQTALLGVDAEDVEDFLLVGQQCDGFRVEGIALQTKMRADHKLNFS